MPACSSSVRSTSSVGSPDGNENSWVTCTPTTCSGSRRPGEALASFVRGVIEVDVHSLTVSLAGTFTPTEELGRLSVHAAELGTALFDRALAAGAVRPELTADDLSMVFEQVTAVRVSDPARTRELRRRYLALLLDALRPQAATGRLPGPPPSAQEIGARWIPR